MVADKAPVTGSTTNPPGTGGGGSSAALTGNTSLHTWPN